jgi:hypothetical protein
MHGAPPRSKRLDGEAGIGCEYAVRRAETLWSIQWLNMWIQLVSVGPLLLERLE